MHTMAASATTPWIPYKVNLNRTPDESPDCRILQTVRHVVHVPLARRIIEDGKLKAGLVEDESILRRRRLAVTWVSANRWGNGSIYGNVEFSFPWRTIVSDRRFYWVEVMNKYNPSAYRILLTNSDRDLSKWGLQAYNPSSDKGPLRERDGIWYWNGNYTSELMIDGDIDLEDCSDLQFIDHNRELCRTHKSSCPDRTADWKRTGARIITFLISNNLKCLDHILKRQALAVEGSMFDFGINGILRLLRDKASFGGPLRKRQSRNAIVRGALALFGSDQFKSARELVSLLQSEKVFDDALVELVKEHFGAIDWHLPTG